MKLAFIIHVFPRLHNTFILNEIIELIRSGIDVRIFSIYRSNERIVNADIEKYSLMERVICLQDHFLKEDFLKKIFRLVRNPHHLSELAKYSEFFDNKTLSSISVISDMLKRENFDFIHAGLGNRPATIAMLLSRQTGIPFTFECHAYDLFVDFPFADEKISETQRIFTISQYNKNYLVSEFLCPESKIIIKRVPFNRSYCDDIGDEGKLENTVVSVCRLHEIKGLEYAIRAVATLKKELSINLKYLIIGDGPLKNDLVSLVEELCLDNIVEFMGDIPNEEALKWIKRSNVSLLPSVVAEDGDRDGIPTALIESMYLKTPVIGSSVSGIPELIDDGVNGFLVSPGDVADISEKLEKLLNDKKMQEEMGLNAREKIKKEFDIDTNMEKMINVFKSQ